jgi:hypothetical protein
VFSTVILMEGQFDLAVLWQAGFRKVARARVRTRRSRGAGKRFDGSEVWRLQSK